jgi:hypothetical protein
VAATQSHATHLESAASVRLAGAGALEPMTSAAGAFVASLLMAVILGVVDDAIASAREGVRMKGAQRRADERVEWTRAEQD